MHMISTGDETQSVKNVPPYFYIHETCYFIERTEYLVAQES